MKYLTNLLIIIILILVGDYFIKQWHTTPTTIITTDTVMVHDTVTVDIPYPIKVVTIDTVYLPSDGNDSVLIPIEKKTYQDSSYYAVISGFKTNIDTLKVYPKIYTITNTKTVYKPKKGFFIRPTFGVGYGIINNRLDAFIGLCLTYNF